jgi:hypothetical protein
MKHTHLRFGKGFTVSIGNRRSQAARTAIAAGKSERGADHRHGGANPWLSGTGGTIVNGKRHRLRASSVLPIETRSAAPFRQPIAGAATSSLPASPSRLRD